MALNSWERRSLAVIEEDLSASAPELQSLLTMFNGLAAGEDMPAHARARRLPRPGRPRRSSRQPRTPRHQQARQFDALQSWWPACVAVWVIFFVGMVATAVALSSVGPQRCPSARAAGCSSLAHVPGPYPASLQRL